MKKMLIAGNWKMNTNAYEASELAKAIVTGTMNEKMNTKILICPPFINIPAVSEIVSTGQVMLGAQNCFSQPSGAYTGEISIPMLQYYKCDYIIIGHSERRQYFHETNETVNIKLKAIINSNLNAIVCIGESLEERQNGQTFAVLEKQIKEGLMNVDSSFASQIVIAYEPIWAIGTGMSANTEQVQEAHSFIREQLKVLFGDKANDMIIQYGGSVKPENALSILELPDVNGALIGGASLKADSFLSIIKIANELLSD